MDKKLTVLLGAILFVPCLIGMPVLWNHAQAAEQTANVQRARADALAQINKFLDGITTMQGRFLQFGPRGERAEGEFALSRPGRLRFRYDPPAGLDIIADGRSIAIIDRKLSTQDLWEIERTPFRHLLSDELDLVGNAREILARDGHILLIMEENRGLGAMQVAFEFEAQSGMLRRWIVTDAQQRDTIISIHDVQFGAALNPQLFEIDRFFNERARQRREGH